MLEPAKSGLGAYHESTLLCACSNDSRQCLFGGLRPALCDIAQVALMIMETRSVRDAGKIRRWSHSFYSLSSTRSANELEKFR